MSERPNDADRSPDDASTSVSDHWLDAVLEKRRRPEASESTEDESALDRQQSEGRTGRLGRPACFDKRCGDAFDDVWAEPDADDPFKSLPLDLQVALGLALAGPGAFVVFIIDPEAFDPR